MEVEFERRIVRPCRAVGIRKSAALILCGKSDVGPFEPGASEIGIARAGRAARVADFRCRPIIEIIQCLARSVVVEVRHFLTTVV